MKNNMFKALWTAGMLSAAVSLAACGSSSGSYLSDNTGSYYNSSDDYFSEEEVDYSSASKAVSGNYADSSDGFVIDSDQKLVYTCTIEMQTKEFDTSVSTIKDLVKQYNGFIESETQSDDAWNWYYSDYEKTSGTEREELTLRIPTENYDAFLNDLEGNGKVLSKSQSVDNITQTYMDTETTIASLQKEEARLLEMMDQCETIEDMITVEDRLSEVQNELAKYESSLNSMDLDVNYSTVCISLEEVLEYSEEPAQTETFVQRLVYTLKDSWSVFTSFLEKLLFFLIYALPICLVLGAIGFGIFFIIRAIVRANRKRNAKRQKKEQAPQPVDKN